MNKLDLDREKILRAREAATGLAKNVVRTARKHTTLTQERTVARLFGIDGTDSEGIPLPNIIVDHLHEEGLLANGLANALADALAYYALTPQEIAEGVMRREIDLGSVPESEDSLRREIVSPYVTAALERIRRTRETRREMLTRFPMSDKPYQYVIVATGNIYEDVKQAQAAARQGADIVAVIRTTGQSLLDYVPYGATTEGFGGTYATQENFRIMRQALDEIGEELGRYIYLVNYCSGLCMPEIAVMGAFERLDMMLNDSMYGILFRDINMLRTFTDQYFSRMINAYAEVIINTGEDNYLTTADAYEQGHTVLASQFINEKLAHFSGMRDWQIGLGHAFEINPEKENSFLYEVAKAQLSREIFPDAPLKYMPPTKYMTGDIFQGQVQGALFNMASVMTNQEIHLLGMLTEAIHTPFLQDRAIALRNSLYVKTAAKDLGKEIMFKPDGIISSFAKEVLDKALDFLLEIQSIGLEEAFAKGLFADVKRQRRGGKGLDGVTLRSPEYFNPFMEQMAAELSVGGDINA